MIERLQAKGVPVTAPANPLRGITADSAYIAAVLEQIDGPVLAVGHSYGGAVITNAATDAKNVVGLVYVAAFAPDEGETLGAVEAGSKDSVLNSALVPRQYPTADGGSATEFSIDPAKARDAFAGDLSDEQAALIAATQRPVAERGVLASRPGRRRGSTCPSWAVVATGDRAAGTDVVRSMAERAGATITEVEGSHVIMISQPEAVTDVILEAVAAVAAVAASEREMSVDDLATGDRRSAPSADRRRRARRRLRRRRPGRRPRGPAAARLAVRHPQLRRGRPAAGGGRLPGDRPVPARLRHDALPAPTRRVRNGEQAALARRRDRADGRARDRDGDRRRVRLGRANGRHRRRALAGALHGPRLGERLPDRQPGGRQAAAAAGGRAAVVVPVLLRHRARPGRLRASTGASSRS